MSDDALLLLLKHLKVLVGLYQQGKLSREQFERKKRLLLAEIASLSPEAGQRLQGPVHTEQDTAPEIATIRAFEPALSTTRDTPPSTPWAETLPEIPEQPRIPKEQLLSALTTTLHDIHTHHEESK